MGKYQSYPEYKDSGVEWLDEVPIHWSRVPIKYMATERGTLFLDGDWIESKDLSTAGIRYITTGNVGEGRYKEQGAGYISEDKFRELNCTEVFEGDLLISRLNNPIGRACVVPDLDGRIVTSVDNVILRPNRAYHKNFLRHVFSSKEYFAHTGLLSRGATMQRISRGLLGNIRIPLPALDEQITIAAFLDHETAKIDHLIAKQERLIELLKEKRQAVISHAVTKGLNPDAPMKDSRVEWLGEVPAHWEVTRLGWITTEINDINHEMPAAVDNGVPFLSAKDLLDDGTLNFTEDVKTISEEDFVRLSAKVRPQRNDIIYSRIGAKLGKARLVETDLKFLISYSCCVVRPQISRVVPSYLRSVLDTDLVLTEAKLRTVGIGVPDLGLNEIARFRIPLPPENEQSAIVNALEERLSKLKQLEDKAASAVSLMKEHRVALISAAVTGKIDVRNFKPANA